MAKVVHPAIVIDDRTAFGQGVAEEFAKEAQKLGLTIVSDKPQGGERVYRIA